MGHIFIPTIIIHISWQQMLYHPINEYVVMYILSELGALVHHHRGDEKLPTSAGKYDQCAPECYSLTSLGLPQPVTHEELIGAYHTVPFAICIKSKLVVIPQLRWTRLGVL